MNFPPDDHLPLRGCLNPDSNHYAVSYVSQSGRNEECLDERVTLRDLQPFKNIIKVTTDKVVATCIGFFYDERI